MCKISYDGHPTGPVGNLQPYKSNTSSGLQQTNENQSKKSQFG